MSNESSSEPRPPEHRSRQPAWVVGGVLILVGLVFVLRDVTGFELHNWWALFLLIPAFGSLVTSYEIYVRAGRRFTPAARGPLVGAAVVLVIAAIFLFGIAWEFAWPFLLIVACVGVMLTAFGRRS